ncbi:MAG: metal-dependent hydrolase [Candidatus Bathyarchaeia archaeon]
MYPLGHISLGYVLSYLISKRTREKLNFLLVSLASLAPDLDFILGIEHRGPTHSIFLVILIFIPIIWIYKRGWIYFAPLLSHSLIGDYLTSYGCKLLWPFSNTWFRVNFIPNSFTLELGLEVALASIMLLLKWRETENKKTRYLKEATPRLGD